MVKVDTVTIPYLQMVQKTDTVYHCTVTTDEMRRPIGTFFNRDIADGKVSDVGQCQHMRARIKRSDRLKFITIQQFLTHEADAIAMNGALTANRYILSMPCPKPQHALSPVLTKGTEMINLLVGIGFQHCRCLKMQVDIRLQLQWPGKENMVTWKHNLPSTLTRTGINGMLNSHGIIGRSIAFRAESHHIIYLCIQG